MTKLTPGKKVIRETAVFDHGRPVVIELESKRLVIRLKGQRQAWPVGYEELLWTACRREADRRRQERANVGKRSRTKASKM